MPTPSRRNFDLTERITSRLRDLVAKYPKGLGLVKEFLQNADDAGASYLRIIYDRRHHPGTLEAPGMGVAFGPALLFINDRAFTSDDLEHIQTISDSGKRIDAARTGRFGQGFATTYSVSDDPSLLTNDTLIWFDPHRRIQEQNRNAYAWDLGSIAHAWPAWLATFAPGGAPIDGSPFPGAIFRLPLRTVEAAQRSEIRKEPFTDDDWEKILGEARAVGPALLVFLRSVLKLEIYEILDSGRERCRLAIRTADEDSVRKARAPLHSAVRGRPLDLLRTWKVSGSSLPSNEFTHSFEVCADDARLQVETWEVISRLCAGPNNILLDEALTLCAAEEKVLPWAGAAARRDGQWSSGRGGFACFLPLPEAGEAPVWLHGWFGLDSSARRSVARNAVEDPSKALVAWNRSLMEHGVGPAWAGLIERLRREVASTTNPYDRWPVEAKPKNEVDAAYVTGFYDAVKALPVFRARLGESLDWHQGTVSLVSLPPPWYARLEAAFSASLKPVLTPPLPAAVRAGLELKPGGPRVLDAGRLRQYLRGLGKIDVPISDAPKTWLSRPEWLTQIAAYCASGGIEHLKDLPLALLADGTMRNFDASVPIYLFRAEDRLLLAPFPDRTVDARYQQVVFEGKPVPSIGVRVLDVKGLVQLATQLTQGGASPTAAWLQAFFERLEQSPPSDIATNTAALQSIAVVPGSGGVLHRPGLYSTPLLPCEDDTVIWALERLGVEFVTTSPETAMAIGRFARRHNGFLRIATPEWVSEVFVARTDGLDWSACGDPDVLTPILDYLATLRWDKVDVRVTEGLRQLPIIPKVGGKRVTADTPRLYVLSDFRPPEFVVSDLSLIDASEHPSWRLFFERLGVRTLDIARFTTELVLPAFAGADATTQDALLRWLRDELPRLEPFLDENSRSGLHRRIRAAEILPVAGGALEAPARVYAPDAKVEELLGKVTRKPDPMRFSDETGRWSKFFEWLRLRRTATAGDLHLAILELVEDANQHGVEHVRTALLRLMVYLDEHWDSLHSVKIDIDTSLVEALSTLAWLPARRLATDECVLPTTPDERLFRPDELAIYGIRDLVASQRPIVDGTFGVTPPKALGLVSTPDPSEVLDHFEVIRTAPVLNHPKAVKALQSSFLAIVRYFGSHMEAATTWSQRIAEDQGARTVLLGRSWRLASQVFLHPLTTALRGACSVQDDPDLAPTVSVGNAVWKGLEFLGVRLTPTLDDWLSVLEELAEEHAGEALPEHLIKVANGAVRELGAAEDEWLRSRNVFVPTTDQRLVLARSAFLPGDPRLRHEMVTPIPVVDSYREIVDVAQRAGARSLNQALHERLHPGTRESRNKEHRQWSKQREARLRSAPFQEALLRLAHHQDLRDGGLDVATAEAQERLARPHRLRVRIADDVRVQSWLDPNTLVFDIELPSFLDGPSDTLWLRVAPLQRLQDELVRAVARQSGVSDTLVLSRLIEREPDDMRALLDEEGVADLPQDRPLDESDVATHDPDSIIGESMSLAERHGTIGESFSPDQIETPGEDSMVDDHDTVNEEDDEENRTAPQTAFSSHPAARPLAIPFGARGTVDPEAPRPLTYGSSLPWSPDRSIPERGRGASGQRLRGYLHALPQSDYDTSAAGASSGRDAQRSALDEVSRRASEAGEVVTGADAVLEGYDLILGRDEARTLVRVIGIDGPWTARGIPLAKRDLEVAQRERDRWRLHVVEHACDPERIDVHVLRNPLDLAGELRLDDAWRALAGAKTPSAPVIGDTVAVEDGRRATVVHIQRFGEDYEVDLQLESGEIRNRVWQPSWKASP